MKEILKILDLVKNKYGYPSVKVLQGPTGTVVMIENKKILMFGSYNLTNKTL